MSSQAPMDDHITKPRYFQICPHCLQFAWEYLVKPEPGMPMSVSNVIHKYAIKVGQIILCQECSMAIPLGCIGPSYLRTIFVKAKNGKI